MNQDQAGKYVEEHIEVLREDVARAKSWIVQAKGHRPDQMATTWLSEQSITLPRSIDTDAANCEELLGTVARAYSLHLAFFEATWELLSASELIPGGPPNGWKPTLEYKTSHYAGGIPLAVYCSYPSEIHRPRRVASFSSDPDIFLEGSGCKSLHDGIQEAIEQSLNCFRRGLYMPATAMLAAAAEATWNECGAAIAKNLKLSKLELMINDPMTGISKTVAEIRKALEQGSAKSLLKAAGQSGAKLADAELWTTVLRERRNALHWGKKKSFTADHAETAALMMGAPLHIRTLESIRLAC